MLVDCNTYMGRINWSYFVTGRILILTLRQ